MSENYKYPNSFKIKIYISREKCYIFSLYNSVVPSFIPKHTLLQSVSIIWSAQRFRNIRPYKRGDHICEQHYTI